MNATQAMSRIINEKTLLPISLVITIGFGIYVIAQLHLTAIANKNRIESMVERDLFVNRRVDDQIDALRSDISRIAERSANIEGKLDTLIFKMDKIKSLPRGNQ